MSPTIEQDEPKPRSSELIAAAAQLAKGRLRDEAPCTSAEDLTETILPNFFAALYPRPKVPQTMDEDLGFLTRMAELVIDSIEMGIISDKEAEALLRFAVSRFASNRFERTLYLNSLECANLLPASRSEGKCWYGAIETEK